MKKLTDEEFLADFPVLGSGGIAKKYGMAERAVLGRRRRLEERTGTVLAQPSTTLAQQQHSAIKKLDIPDGVVIVASDAHYWPGEPTAAHRALIHFLKKIKPVAVIANGDMFDGASISRWPRVNFEERPKVHEELEVVQLRMGEIIKASPRAIHIWNLGNHDSRFETFLAAKAPEFERVPGFTLKDHFKDWTPAWSTHVNGHTVIKHRGVSGGQHAPFMNTLRTGWNIVTGHLHSGKVYPYTDMHGSRYGFDNGFLSHRLHPAFINYTEAGFPDWRSGFGHLTFREGRLMWPEFVHVLDEEAGLVEFRGELINV